MALLAAPLAALALRRVVGLKPGPSLDGGQEELSALRLIRSRNWPSVVAMEVSCARSCSFSSLRVCTWPTKSLTLAGVTAKPASEIQLEGALIACSLYLRCNQD
jgi:hypothetical protein